LSRDGLANGIWRSAVVVRRRLRAGCTFRWRQTVNVHRGIVSIQSMAGEAIPAGV